MVARVADIAEDTSAREPGDVSCDGPLGEEATPLRCQCDLDGVVCPVSVVPGMAVSTGNGAAVEWGREAFTERREAGADGRGERRRDAEGPRVFVCADGD